MGIHTQSRYTDEGSPTATVLRDIQTCNTYTDLGAPRTTIEPKTAGMTPNVSSAQLVGKCKCLESIPMRYAAATLHPLDDFV